MKETLLELVKQSGMYAAANLLFKLAGFLLAFLYLDPAFLSQEAYGRLAILDVTAKVVIPLFGLGISNGLLKFWVDAKYEKQREDLPFTVLIAVVGTATVALVLIMLSAPALAEILLDSSERGVLIRMLAGYIALKIVANAPMAFIRVRERVDLNAFAIALEMGTLVVGVYYYLAMRGEGLLGVMKAYLMSAGISTIVLTAGLLWVVQWRMRFAFLWKLMRFGAPLAFAGVGILLLNLGDRYLLKWLADTSTVAVYDWSARLGSVLYLLFVQSFSTAFMVLGAKELGSDARDADLHRRTFRHYVVWTGWAALGLSLLAYDVTNIISPNPAYLAADRLVLPIALGFLFYGIYHLMVNILYVGGQTGTIASNIFVAALFNAALNVVLIPVMGAMGAALATTASYIGLVVLTTRVALRHTESRFPWLTLGKVLLLVVGLYALGKGAVDWAAAMRLGWRLLLIVLYPALVMLWQIYTWEEVKVISSRLWQEGRYPHGESGH